MSSFIQVTAVDADGDAVVYRLTRPPGPFVVVPQTGEIILTENPQVHTYIIALRHKKRFIRDLIFSSVVDIDYIARYRTVEDS
jgi:hypothetical protein